MSITTDPNALLMGGGKSFSFETIGDKVSGLVVAAEAAQQIDMDTDQPATWPDGKPKMQVIVTLQTELDEEAGDDGQRRVYLKGSKPTTSMGAVKAAIKAAGASGIEVGGKLQLAYTGDGEPTKKGWNAPKQYAAKYEPPAPVQAAVDDIFGD